MTVLAVGEPDDRSLAIDDELVYWVRWISLQHGAVLRVPRRGGPVVTLAELDENMGPSITLLGNNAIVSGTLSGDFRVPRSGGPAVAITSRSRFLKGAADADHLCWWDDGHLVRARVDGGEPEWLADEPEIPLEVWPGGDGVYWLVSDYRGSAIRRAVAGITSTVVENAAYFTGMALDDHWIYWLSRPEDNREGGDSALWRISRTGGEPVLLAKGPFRYGTLATREGYVYVVRSNEAMDTSTLIELTDGREATILRVAGDLWTLVADRRGLHAWHDRTPESRELVGVAPQ